MPHDIDGKKIKPGDVVIVRFKVKVVHETEEYCNIDLETCLSIYPSNNKSTLTLNTKQVELIEKG